MKCPLRDHSRSKSAWSSFWNASLCRTGEMESKASIITYRRSVAQSRATSPLPFVYASHHRWPSARFTWKHAPMTAIYSATSSWVPIKSATDLKFGIRLTRTCRICKTSWERKSNYRSISRWFSWIIKAHLLTIVLPIYRRNQHQV